MQLRWGVLVVLAAGGCRARLAEDAPARAPAGPAAREQIAVPGGPGPVPGLPAERPRTPDPALSPDEARLAIEVPPATAGVETTAHVRLTANHGYEINERFHYKLTLDPTPGVTLPRTVFTQAAHDAERLDRQHHELTIAMRLTADQPGDYIVHGTLDFAVCKIDRQCMPKTMPVAVRIAAR
jgi:hypothetical protein